MDIAQNNVTGHSFGGRKASTIDQFCADHSISRAMFYRLQKEGKAPRTMRAGSKQLISEEAAAEWRQVMTAA
jgi:predicted DNA-binding transcriptional regulator AlpA